MRIHTYTHARKALKRWIVYLACANSFRAYKLSANHSTFPIAVF